MAIFSQNPSENSKIDDFHFCKIKETKKGIYESKTGILVNSIYTG